MLAEEEISFNLNHRKIMISNIIDFFDKNKRKISKNSTAAALPWTSLLHTLRLTIAQFDIEPGVRDVIPLVGRRRTPLDYFHLFFDQTNSPHS